MFSEAKPQIESFLEEEEREINIWRIEVKRLLNRETKTHAL